MRLRVLRRVGARRVGRVHARVVLVREDEHVVAGVGLDRVGEALAGDLPPWQLARREPDLDLVARVRTAARSRGTRRSTRRSRRRSARRRATPRPTRSGWGRRRCGSADGARRARAWRSQPPSAGRRRRRRSVSTTKFGGRAADDRLGVVGVGGGRATESANGTFFSNSAWISSSSSGKSKPLPQSAAIHSSSGSGRRPPRRSTSRA